MMGSRDLILSVMVSILLAGMLLPIGCASPTVQNRPLAKNRSFYMGTTPGIYDLTVEAVAEKYKFLEKNADIIAHHLDEGIPWQEAFERKRYHPNVENDLDERVKNSGKKKVYLALTPVRDGGLATYWGKDAQMKREGRWKNMAIEHPDAATAYMNFCRDLIRRFRPDFMNYGIEVNMLAKNRKQWSQFVKLAQQVYTTLKRENPGLPLFVSLQIDEYWQDEQNQKQAVQQILPYTDYIAVSSYPYFYGYFDPKTIRKDFISSVAALASDKPFAVAETGFIAKNLDALGKKGPGSEEWQNEYLNFVLEETNKLKGRFLIWFVPRDYEPLIETFRAMKVPNEVIELFKVWVNAGLLDSKGNKHLAFETWSQWLDLPRK